MTENTSGPAGVAVVAGAVLVGGRSRRMGRDKALIEIDGVPMARRVADVLVAAGCRPVVAIGPAHLAAGLDAIADEHPGEGPLGGILTALRAMAVQPVLVLACDLPWVDSATIAALIAAAAEADADVDVVMAVAERREPLCAVWMAGSAVELQRAFSAGERAVHRAAARLRVTEVPVSAHGLINVNAPEDLPSE
jgi:molybdopterin-guanine dinucleotide biosynthesis protein A